MSWVLDEEVLAVVAAVAIVAVVFAVSQVLYAGRVVEPFSELGLLGPYGKIGDYPREVVAGLPFLLNVYIGNHEGKTMYYRVLVKVGDKSSIVNASTPLNVEPVMDIRAVLSHNSSLVIPVNVTLYEPAVNVRLVFEMWVFNETLGVFSYHGRWNQLWLNVTEPTEPVSLQRASLLDSEVESRVVEAYLAVRRAERLGGDTSEMVNLLNTAIVYAFNGRISDAEILLDEVLLLEPRVAEAGVEAGRLRLYTTIAGVTVASSASVGLYLFLRRNLWLLWAKAHRGWRIVLSGGDGKSKDYRSRVRDMVKSNVELTVGDFIGGSKDARIAAKELHRMVRSGAVKIFDPNPPKTFQAYLCSRYNLGFISASLTLAFGVLCIYTSEVLNPPPYGLSTVVAVARYVLGSIMVLFLPGYSLVEALYPSGEELKPLERLALSIGLSLAVVPLIGLILNDTPWGIRLTPVTISLVLFTETMVVVASMRKYSFFKSRLEALEGRIPVGRRR